MRNRSLAWVPVVLSLAVSTWPWAPSLAEQMTPSLRAVTSPGTDNQGRSEPTPSGPYVVKNWRSGLALEEYTSGSFRKLRLSNEQQNPTMIKLTGEARVHAGIFQAQLKDDSGRLLEAQTKMVASATPAWSPFELGFSVSPAKRGHVCILEIYEENPKDGTPLNKLTIHLLY